MSSSTPDAPTVEPPEGAGLPLGRSSESEPHEPRRGDELIGAAARGEALSEREQRDLVGYFLTNDGLPGDDEPNDVQVTVGKGRSARKETWQVRTIAWEEWRDAIERTTDQETGERDTLASSGWIVARALVRPNLAPALKALRARAEAEPDGKLPGPGGARLEPPQTVADVLVHMFRRQAGVLFELSGTVLTLSKLQADNGSVKVLDEETEAGKR